MNFQETLPPTQNIVLFGCGAMAIETAMYINDVANQLSTAKKTLLVSDIVSTEFGRIDELQSVLGYNVNLHRAIEDVENFQQKQSLVAIGSAAVVKSIAADVRNLGGSFITIIHPTAIVSDTATLGHGVIVAPFSFIGPFSCLSDNVIVNVRSTIGHDVTVGSGVIISPHVDINGASTVGDFSFLGAGVTVDPQINIGRYTKVSSGVAVKKNVPDGMMVFNHQSAKQVKLFRTEDGDTTSPSNHCEINFIERIKMRYVFAGDREISVKVLTFLMNQGLKPLALMVTNQNSQSHANELKDISQLPESHIWEGKSFASEHSHNILNTINPDYIIGIHFPYIIPEKNFRIT